MVEQNDDTRYDEAVAGAASELGRVVERLDELAFEILRDASEAGATSRPELERVVTRSRNAVERAIALLERNGTSDRS